MGVPNMKGGHSGPPLQIKRDRMFAPFLLPHNKLLS